MRIEPIGPEDADIMIVGECPGSDDLSRGVPFVGASGLELSKMLLEAGIDRSKCFITNVTNYKMPLNDIKSGFLNKTEAKKQGVKEVNGRRPTAPIIAGIQELYADITRVQPKMIICLGDAPLWALTGESGINKWRGSMMETPKGIKVLPTISPKILIKQWHYRYLAMHDLRRAADYVDEPWPKPDYNFLVQPSFEQVMDILTMLEKTTEPLDLSVDIETRLGFISCIGLAWSRLDAICIPFMWSGQAKGYWPLEEETQIILRLRNLLRRTNVKVIGQNYLYDAQYEARLWGFLPHCDFDTMIAHHTLFSADLPKGLDTLSSLYCEYHRYWKDEGKEWRHGMDETQHWVYNCKDAVNTWEIKQTLTRVIKKMGHEEQFAFQMRMFKVVLRTMLRGVVWDAKWVNTAKMELQETMGEYAAWFERVMPEELTNPKAKAPYYRSPTQLATILYKRFGYTPIKNRKTKRVTTDDDALKKLAQRDTVIAPLCRRILEYRSMGVFFSTFLSAAIDNDNRVRCSYNIAGTETFRLSSSTDAFGYGMNLQNIPEGGEK